MNSGRVLRPFGGKTAICALFVVIVVIGLQWEDARAQAAAITIGETNILPTNDSGNGNLLIAQRASLSQTATIQSLSFYVPVAAGTLRLGIYDSTGPSGGPGAKKAETNEMTPVVGWNTGNVISQVSLSAGNYWLAYLPSSNGLYFRNTGTGSAAWYSYTYGPMPARFSTLPNTGTVHWSLYATLNTVNVPDTTPPTVSLSAPANNAAVAGIAVPVTAAASDNVGVAGVQFLLD